MNMSIPFNSDDALIAFDTGDYKKAFQLYLVGAGQGDAIAQYRLGLMYADGQGISRDKKEAVKWCRLAAEQGYIAAQVDLGFWFTAHGYDAKEAVKWYRSAAVQGNELAQWSLGVLYKNGQGVPQDDKEAAKWLRLAAEQGSLNAQWDLVKMYVEGRVVPQDDKEEVKWLQMGVEYGLAVAQCNLGTMYSKGRGVSPDDKEAVKWFQLAAEQGQAAAQYNLGITYANGRGVPQDDKEAVKWFRLAAQQGEACAQYNLGMMYDNGLGVPQDDKEAAKWFRLAAKQGLADAQHKLGRVYAKGRGVPHDDKEAVKWFRLASWQGKAIAQTDLGIMYANGRGVQQDDKEAVKWLQLAAEQGNARAQFELGSIYTNDRGVPRDDKEAEKWFRLAAEQGDDFAQCNLGMMYANALGVPRDDTEAVKWFRLAAEQGNVTAEYNLGKLVTPPSLFLVKPESFPNFFVEHLGKYKNTPRITEDLYNKMKNQESAAAFDLLLFDLDNTLIGSDNLKDLRGIRYANDESRSYRESILVAASKVKILIDEDVILKLRAEFPQIKLGVFTRAPKTYTNVLLEHLYSSVSWNCVITYGDTKKTKPNPDGLLLAAQLAQVRNGARIAYVGDESIDIIAAYQAGAYAVLFKGSWGDISYQRSKQNPKRTDHNRAVELIPDAVLESPQDIARLIKEPLTFMPPLECWDSGGGYALPRKWPRVEELTHFNNLPEVERPNNWVRVQILGRYFATRSRSNNCNFSPKRHDHRLTEKILAAKNGQDYPEEWVECCAHYISHVLQRLEDYYSHQSIPLVICQIPARPGQPLRMEKFIDRLEAKITNGDSIFFNTNILGFKVGAVSNKQLHPDEKYKNRRDHLYVSEPSSVVGKDVLVIDDVTTSGATFFYADRYLKAAGASSVRCITLAHTIS